MHGILVNIGGVSRITIVGVNIVIAIIAGVVGHQIGIELHVVQIVQIETIQIALVFAVASTGIVICDFVAIDFPAGIVINLCTVEIVVCPVVLNYVVFKQVP
jgi:hypothetical protein